MPTTSTKLSVGLEVFLHRQTSESCCERRGDKMVLSRSHTESFCIESFVKKKLRKRQKALDCYLCTFVQNMLGKMLGFLSLSHSSAPSITSGDSETCYQTGPLEGGLLRTTRTTLQEQSHRVRR